MMRRIQRRIPHVKKIEILENSVPRDFVDRQSSITPLRCKISLRKKKSEQNKIKRNIIIGRTNRRSASYFNPFSVSCLVL